jgi:hypothetical protein
MKNVFWAQIQTLIEIPPQEHAKQPSRFAVGRTSSNSNTMTSNEVKE